VLKEKEVFPVVETKYGKLVRKLAFQPGRGGANARELTIVTGDELVGFDFNFIIGVYDQTGDWAPNSGAHSHPFDECLLFFGYDPDDMAYLGSDMSLCLGKERETHKFSVPTVAIAPKGVPHCPLVTDKVYKPFGHFHLALAAKYSGTRVPEEGKTDGKQYAHLVKKFDIRKGPGGADAKQFVAFSGLDLEGFNISFNMGLFNKAGKWSTATHVHPYDECLVFFGHDTANLGYLGAELTVDIGKEHEKHTFDVPTVVSIPRGTPHFPIVCNKLDKPYRMMQVGLSNKYQSSPA
jgi:hypothetical protein